MSWRLDVCQTQPVKMPWCPLRRFAETLCHLRGGVKREQEMHIHCFSRDDDFADQALRDGLPVFKRELRQIRPQQLAKGRGIVNHLLPLDALLSRVGQLPTFLLDLLQRSSKFLPPRVVFQKWRWTAMNVTLGLIFVASHRKEWPMTFIAVRCPHCQSDHIVKRGKRPAAHNVISVRTPFVPRAVAQFLAVCRRSKMVAMGTRRPRSGLRLCWQCALHRRGNMPRLR